MELRLLQISILIACSVNTALGLVVFIVNPRRRANRHFLTTSIGLNLWFGCMIAATFSHSTAMRLFWIRQAHFVAILLPVAFDLLRLAITHATDSWRAYARQLSPWLVLFIAAAALAQSPHFVTDLRTEGTFFSPVFGQGHIVYILLWVSALAVLVARYTRDLVFAKGIERVELQFILLGAVLAPAVGVTLGNVVPLLSGAGNVPQLMPLSVILLDLVIAYGIVTRRIMNVTAVLRRGTAYLLLAGYLVGLYVAIQYALVTLLGGHFPGLGQVSHIVAALAVAFSVAPANGWMQTFANRLFINMQSVDVRRAVQQAREAMTTIGTTDELLERFAEIVKSATGTDSVVILLARGDASTFVQTFPKAGEEEGVLLSDASPLVRLLVEQKEPLSLDGIRRQRPTQLRIAAANTLTELGTHLAIGVQSKGNLQGVMLLGARLSGKIYGADEQDALQFFCDQIAVSLENAELYTEVQDSKIYNEILLDSLVSGVIAVNADRVTTVFNREAQRITGRRPSSVVGRDVVELPEAIAGVVLKTLETDSGIWDEDLTITRGEDEEIPVRLSTSGFRSHKGDQLGVLVVLNDMSIVRKLEEQVRRTDRLASLGTLSAGMAHEIKNPLVSIKTFTQLLPERYDDEEFRETFSDLIGQEVKRIDSIVNRLLHFARPAKARLVQIHLDQVLDDSLRLIDQQLRRCNIQLERGFESDHDSILGDADLLSQTFINFFLNAIEAMESGGTLTVRTSINVPEWYSPARANRRSAQFVRVSITDTGAGILAEDLPRVFDPFFTTKSAGTGLGLSVSHGIIQEHGATVDVDSEPGRGTTFHLMFPLVEEEEADSDEHATRVHPVHAE